MGTLVVRVWCLVHNVALIQSLQWTFDKCELEFCEPD